MSSRAPALPRARRGAASPARAAAWTLALALPLAACNGLGAQSSDGSASTTGSGSTSESESTSGSGSESETAGLACADDPIACRRATLLISAADLEVELAADPLVLDLRSAAEYDVGHVPGARLFDPALLRAEVDGVSGQVADQATVEAVLAAVGVASDRPLIAYDDGTALAAARLAWTLHYYGKTDVRVVDGGWQAWSAGGHPVAAEATPASPAALALAAGDPLLRVDAAWIADRLGDPGLALVDARAAAEYDAGHLPGAIHIPWQETKDAADLFLADAPLRAVYEGAGVLAADTVVVYCQTGSRASPSWLSLMLLDHPDVRLYDGSWAEWGADPNLPKEP